MNISTVCGGDPLLLISDIYEIDDADFVPCIFTRNPLEDFHGPLKNSARCITLNDSLSTILISIKNAPYVITDFLEGLVMGDSFGVPTSFVSDGAIPFVVRDYLNNFDRSNQGVIEKLPDTLGGFCSYRVRNISSLKHHLLSTMPSL